MLIWQIVLPNRRHCTILLNIYFDCLLSIYCDYQCVLFKTFFATNLECVNYTVYHLYFWSMVIDFLQVLPWPKNFDISTISQAFLEIHLLITQNNIKTAKTCLHFVIKINQLREYLEYIPDFIQKIGATWTSYLLSWWKLDRVLVNSVTMQGKYEQKCKKLDMNRSIFSSLSLIFLDA